jgi:NAD(P)-dependent dehydrogenase (short-subunit alcohol dehydrogenase family)
MNIKGKTAIITGGAHRVGKAITLALAETGANVVINYFSSSTAAEETAAEAQSYGVDVLIYQCDIAHPDQVEAMVKAAEKRFGGLDILVNSAGLWQSTPFPVEDYTDWQRVIDITINGSFYCANYAAPLLLRNPEGAIVNIIDASAFRPFRNFIAHSVAKSGLWGMTRQLALELAPKVRVNAVSPGPVLPPPDFTEEQIQRVARRTLRKKWGTAQDVAQAVVFLVQADYITGEFITVDGGEQYGITQ